MTVVGRLTLVAGGVKRSPSERLTPIASRSCPVPVNRYHGVDVAGNTDRFLPLVFSPRERCGDVVYLKLCVAWIKFCSDC